jgi:hypothetical protein
MENDNQLLNQLVNRFEEDAGADYFDGPLWQLYKTPKERLLPIYSKINKRFPVLYEKLLLNYRWNGAEVGLIRFLRNPPSSDFSHLAQEMFGDKGIYDECSKHGFVQFGRGSNLCYDPVCFDTRTSKDPQKYSIVQLDHEEILCNFRIRIVATLSDTFEHLIHRILNEFSLSDPSETRF